MSNSKTWCALALMILPLTIVVASAASTQIPVSGKPGPYNSSCFSDCFKTFRSHGTLKTVVLDSNGQVFKVLRTALPDSAKLNSSSSSQSPTGNTRPNAAKRRKADADYFQNFTYKINEGTGTETQGYGTDYFFITIFTVPNAKVTQTTVYTYTDRNPSRSISGAYTGGELTNVKSHTTTEPIRSSGGKRNAN